MRPFRLAFLMLLALAVAPVAIAQNLPAPAVGLSAQPSLCPDSQPGYTCNANINVSWAIPQIVQQGCQGSCHFEFCLTQTGPSGGALNCSSLWTNPNNPNADTTYMLTGSSGANPVWAEYRTVSRGGRDGQ